jgi:hypothetical protein
MPRPTPQVALVLSAIFLAGCLGATTPKVDGDGDLAVPKLDPVYERLRKSLADLPCTVASVPLSDTSANLRAVARDALRGEGPVSSYGELAFHGSLFAAAYYNNEGFVLANVSDPGEPYAVGAYLSKSGGNTYDVKFSTNGTIVYAAFKDRIELVDVRDPTKPARVSTFTHPANYPGQAHMLGVTRLGHDEYVFAVPSISGTGVLVARRTGEDAQARLELVTVWTSTQPSPYLPQALAPHDVYITHDPKVNATLLYAANGFNGIVVFDITDPKAPRTVAAVPPGAGGIPTSVAPSYYHSIQVHWFGDRRILATSAEVGYNTVRIWDATDFSNVRFLGQWVYDQARPFLMNHNLQIVNGTLYVAHYGEGLFVFDLGAFVDAPGAGLRPVGHYQPATGGLLWDVVLRDGLILLTNISQGLEVVGYGCLEVGNEALTSTG